MKMTNINKKFLHILWTTWWKFNETFKKDVFYDNIKSHKKSGFHPVFRRYIFQRTIVGGVNGTLGLSSIETQLMVDTTNNS